MLDYATNEPPLPNTDRPWQGRLEMDVQGTGVYQWLQAMGCADPYGAFGPSVAFKHVGATLRLVSRETNYYRKVRGGAGLLKAVPPEEVEPEASMTMHLHTAKTPRNSTEAMLLALSVFAHLPHAELLKYASVNLGVHGEPAPLERLADQLFTYFTLPDRYFGHDRETNQQEGHDGTA